MCDKQAESRLAQHRAARAEAREIRSRELERQRREVMDRFTNLCIYANKQFVHNCAEEIGLVV